MTELETLQLAGKALGYTVTENGADIYGRQWYGATELAGIWMPHLYQKDSDCLACDLVIGHSWFDGAVACFTHVGRINRVVSHDGTIEGRRAAVRQARLLVAVEIGRTK